ncbi:hypothetical protein AB1Y20_003648 [Prymnesium parvum]|uniref:peptidylprolyl isomerase n=1 Tax=Prymnesium parvum TaxID=97485 RepID=A0AB34J750_PRYPA
MALLTTKEAAATSADELLAQIERRKREGNEHYARGDLNASMQAWLAAIWLLKLDRPPYPDDLSAQLPPSDVAAARLLGRGPALAPASPPPPAPAAAAAAAPSPSFLGVHPYAVGLAALATACAVGATALLHSAAAAGVGVYFVMRQRRRAHAAASPPKTSRTMDTREAARAERREGVPSLYHPPAARKPQPELETPAAEKLRCSLHLNVALCALKRDDFYLAREACRYVLSVEPEDAKALFRLAQAHEGEGDLPKAVKTLAALVRHEPANREARALLAELRARSAAQRDLFRGVCAKKGFVQPDEEQPASAKPPKEDELTSRIRSLLEHEEKEKYEKELKEREAQEKLKGDAAAKAARTEGMVSE